MRITIALAKGRLSQKAAEIFTRAGIDCSAFLEDTRKLIFYDKENDIRFLMVKPLDVPTYVGYGIADMGVAGKDTLLEAGLPLYEMVDLKFGACRLCIAGYAKMDQRITASALRVATKYPEIAKKYYAQKSQDIEVIKLNGSVELGPMLGLSDVILDIVESGRTLADNGLLILEEVEKITARLCVNRASLKTKAKRLKPLIQKVKDIVEAS